MSPRTGPVYDNEKAMTVSDTPFVGIVNQRNACYLISVLQLLFAHDAFRITMTASPTILGKLFRSLETNPAALVLSSQDFSALTNTPSWKTYRTTRCSH